MSNYERLHFDHGNNLYVRFHEQLSGIVLNIECNPTLAPWPEFVADWCSKSPAKKATEARALVAPLFVLSDILTRSDLMPIASAQEIYDENKDALAPQVCNLTGCPDPLVRVAGAQSILHLIAFDKSNKRPLTSWLKAQTFITNLQRLDARFATLVPTAVNILNELCATAKAVKEATPVKSDVPAPYWSSLTPDSALSIPTGDELAVKQPPPVEQASVT